MTQVTCNNIIMIKANRELFILHMIYLHSLLYIFLQIKCTCNAIVKEMEFLIEWQHN